MTLATHAAVGGTVAVLFPSHPITAFVAGFLSHFVLDAVPHWDYRVLSAYADPDAAMSGGGRKADRYFCLDLLHISTDAVLGILITLVVWRPTSMAQLMILSLGMIGGVLPDFLQFVYARFPRQPMVLIQKFHDLMHAPERLDNRPFIGIPLQIAIVAGVILLVKYLVLL